MKLSPSTIRQIQWDQIDDSTAGLRSKGASEAADEPLAADQAAKFKRVFDTAQEEFQRVLSSLKKSTDFLVIVVFVGLGMAIGGGFVIGLLKQQILGAFLSTAGISASTTLVFKIWNLGRDQAMLSLIPTKYQLAFELARTADQYDRLLDRFMTETSTLRG